MFVGEAGTRLRDPLQHGNAGRWYEQRLSLFYPLRPRKARSRPPILGGQLIETEEHKDSFLRVGCFNDGLIRVLQTHACMGLVYRGYRYALPSVIINATLSRASHGSNTFLLLKAFA